MRIAVTATSVLTLAALTPTTAAEIVRDADQIADMPIQGVTLATSPRDAFEHLTSLGYAAGPIESYGDWDESGIEMVRGSYADPEGESRITLTRANRRLVNITESFNRPREPFDTTAEIGALHSYFDIAEDDPTCRLNTVGSGSCRVADAEEEANLVYGTTLFPTMIQRYATRNHELKDVE